VSVFQCNTCYLFWLVRHTKAHIYHGHNISSRGRFDSSFSYLRKHSKLQSSSNFIVANTGVESELLNFSEINKFQFYHFCGNYLSSFVDANSEINNLKSTSRWRSRKYTIIARILRVLQLSCITLI
jgi:hypothetical protein